MLARWAGFAVLLHGLWEVAHLPLYTLWDDPDSGRIVRYVLHCLAGDVLIAVVAFLVAAMAFRDLDWPRRRPWPAGALAVAVGLGFTVWSEWYNVTVLGAWVYAPAMPTVAGIGLTPLLQWLVVPVLMVFIVRHGQTSRRAAAPSRRKNRAQRG